MMMASARGRRRQICTLIKVFPIRVSYRFENFGPMLPTSVGVEPISGPSPVVGSRQSHGNEIHSATWIRFGPLRFGT